VVIRSSTVQVFIATSLTADARSAESDRKGPEDLIRRDICRAVAVGCDLGSGVIDPW
jgi:hypothetical protein